MQTRQQIHCSPAEKIRSKAFKKITAFILLIICVSCSHFANAQTTDFKFTVNTSLGTLPTQFIFPATGQHGWLQHFCGWQFNRFCFCANHCCNGYRLTAGVHTFRVSGNLTRVNFNNGGDKLKITSIDQWGSAITWTSLSAAYWGCTNLTINATDAPVLTSVTDMTNAFRSSGISTTGNLNSWSVSKVTSFWFTFGSCTNFNQNLSGWGFNGGGFNQLAAINMQQMFSGCTNFNNGDAAGASDMPLTWSTTNKVTDMSSMFLSCSSFNQSIATFRVNGVIDFSSMLHACTKFNQNLSAWETNGGFNQLSAISMSNMFNGCAAFNNGETGNTGSMPLTWSTTNKVSTMIQMFTNCAAFNQPLPNLCVSGVTIFTSMFQNCSVFNQNLNSWGTNCTGFNTAGTTTVSGMFNGCDVFNNGDAPGASTMPLSSWNTIGFANMNQMFLSCVKFNQPLNTWNTSNVTNFNSTFNNCPAFNQPLNAWVISKGTIFNYMFQNCTSFNQDLTNWGTNGR